MPVMQGLPKKKKELEVSAWQVRSEMSEWGPIQPRRTRCGKTSPEPSGLFSSWFLGSL